jgi:20S proteasome alpha/beta subunit
MEAGYDIRTGQTGKFLYTVLKLIMRILQLVLSAVYLATFRDGSSGGVIRLAIIDKDGTRREVRMNFEKTSIKIDFDQNSTSKNSISS